MKGSLDSVIMLCATRRELLQRASTRRGNMQHAASLCNIQSSSGVDNPSAVSWSVAFE
jgi:hypothetical protein